MLKMMSQGINLTHLQAFRSLLPLKDAVHWDIIFMDTPLIEFIKNPLALNNDHSTETTIVTRKSLPHNAFLSIRCFSSVCYAVNGFCC